MAYDIFIKHEGKDLYGADHIGTQIKELDESNRTFLAIASTESADREGDILRVKGWRLGI